MDDRDETIARLREKLTQARQVITYLVNDGHFNGTEGRRAVDYFSRSDVNPDFLPWPLQDEEGLRPEQLNASNDG